jgi:hypothetical protein
VEEKTPRQRLAAFMPICIVLISANIIYIGIIYYIEQNGGLGLEKNILSFDTANYLFFAAIILSVILALAAPRIFKKIISGYNPKIADNTSKNRKNYLFFAGIILSAISALSTHDTHYRNNLKAAVADSKNSDYFKRYTFYWFIFMMFASIPVAVGFIIYIGCGEAEKAYICIISSIFVMLLNLPKRAHLEKLQEIESNAARKDEDFKIT